MVKNSISPKEILELTIGHWKLKALAVAVDVSVFTLLEEKELNIEELSQLSKVPKHSLELLINANVSLGFINKDNKKYSNTEIAKIYLVEGSSDYLGDFIKLSGIHGFDKWSHFKKCVMNDKPIEDLEKDFEYNEEKMKYFTKAMHNNAKKHSRVISGNF